MRKLRSLALSVSVLLCAAGARAADRALFFLFDTSGSLRPAELEQAKRVAAFTAQKLGPESLVGVMSFDDRATVLAPLGQDRDAVARALPRLTAHGRFTTLYDALHDAARELGGSGAPRRGIILLTDGRDENSALIFDDALRELSTGQVAVFAIGVGGRVDEKFMRRIAKLTQGEYFPAETLQDPKGLIARIDAALAAFTPTPTPAPASPSAAVAAVNAPPAATTTAAPVAATPATRTPAVAPSPRPSLATTRPAADGGASVPARRGSPTLLRVALALAIVALLAILWIWLRSRTRPGAPAETAAETVPEPPPPVRPPLADATRSAPAAALDLSEERTEAHARPAFPPPAEARPPAPPVAKEKDEVTVADPDFAEVRDALSSTSISGQSPYVEGEPGLPDEQLDKTFFLEEKPVLVIQRGRNVGETFLLEPEGSTTIGRGTFNTVVLDDHTVSKRHVGIRCEGRLFSVRDLGSTNGSFLNDRLLEGEAPLKPGDVIRVGETDLVFKLLQKRR